jgi:hypothetical protein
LTGCALAKTRRHSLIIALSSQILGDDVWPVFQLIADGESRKILASEGGARDFAHEPKASRAVFVIGDGLGPAVAVSRKNRPLNQSSWEELLCLRDERRGRLKDVVRLKLLEGIADFVVPARYVAHSQLYS